jgi:heme exporter protein A
MTKFGGGADKSLGADRSIAYAGFMTMPKPANGAAPHAAQPFPHAVLAGHDLACRRGDQLVFHGLNFTLEPGEALCLYGPNGSGKTSLLRLLAGLSPPFSGEIRWNGEALSRTPALLREQAMFAGFSLALKEALSVYENLQFWSRFLGDGGHDQKALMEAAINRLGLEDLLAIPLHALSSGQRKRVSLARLLLAPRPLWLLDEPTTALDRDHQARLIDLLGDHLAQGGLAVLATHQSLDLPGPRLDLDGYAPAFDAPAFQSPLFEDG